MVSIETKLETLREAGRIGAEVLKIDRPPVAYNCPSNEEGVQFEKDEYYWPAFQEMREKLEQFGEIEVSDYRDEPSPFLALIGRRSFDGDVFAQIHIDYHADGGGHISIEYLIEGGWHTMADHDVDDLDSVEIGRLAARAELSILANELGSATEALDYWMTEESAYYSEAKYTQSRWAKARNVSRQNVNQRVQSVKKQLGDQSP